MLVQLRTASSEEDWFGFDHYVEVNDQAHGQYGGIRSVEVLGNSLVFDLTGRANLFDEPVKLTFSEPMAVEAVSRLSPLGSQR